ncbi:Diacetyl reductase [(S)-acetoin forming] [Neolecta irregularis DAH-3]|uniref:Diacetyl reductase [(S)-acetoin forming] n=1 Tax=Neolecta irregularis (strain DAH-3) TaxID=1198029 RepID=A0A1U7LT57_NEOID|nr:Diacetyl reductase [(S)-acetoin forming] [Neolecta irregularis DAH-3]|eukprot:OLL25798.1 Diacetyl reductase [(S)-acetoin forming] [Neolecta irregularis DAH-3]
MPVAIITGSAQGLGEAVAIRLAKDGNDIILFDLPAQQQLLQIVSERVQKLGRKVLIVTGDVTSEESVNHLIQQSLNLGPLSIMIANAAVALFSPIAEQNIKDLDHHMAVNIRGVFLCYKYAALQMVEQGTGGVILGASSVSGLTAIRGFAAYGATKWAVRGLTKCMALEFGHHGIRVNCYSPSAMSTKMFEQVCIKTAEAENVTVAQIMLRYTGLFGRVGKPEDVSNVVGFLCSDEASFITGQDITIDGGRLLKL